MTEAGTGTARGRVRLVVVVVALAMVLSACNWTQFRADPGHSGYQPFESKIGPANVSNLVHTWSGSIGGPTSSPSVANGVADMSGPRALYAFDTGGVKSCSGVPKQCGPLWTADLGVGIDNFGPAIYSTPAVSDGVIYVGSVDGNLYTFDAAGVKSCSGVPKRCLPLWTAFAGGVGLGGIRSSPTVANGVVYVVPMTGGLYAFDAEGVQSCSGAAKTCAPLWTATTGGFAYSSPAVANGVVYLGSYIGTFYAFDAAGVQSCSGAPRTCAPLWTANVATIVASPAVVNGTVYLSAGSVLYAFDASGVRSCSGAPKTCAPVWTVSNDAGTTRRPRWRPVWSTSGRVTASFKPSTQ